MQKLVHMKFDFAMPPNAHMQAHIVDAELLLNATGLSMVALN